MGTTRYYYGAIVLFVILYKQQKDNRKSSPVKDVQLVKTMSDVIMDGTSLNCTGNTPENKTCHFRNVCYSYSKDVFVYIHSPNSQELYSHGNGQEALRKLTLTPVTDIDIFVRYINVSSQRLGLHEDDFIFKPGKYIIFSRYVPNHIMFLFHSELLPLYYTILRYFHEKQFLSIKLFIKDNGNIGDFSSLYKALSPHPPLFRYELGLEVDGTLACFQEATIGLVRESSWHQHGFKELAGPITNSSATAKHIRQFTIFLKQKLGIHPDCPKVHYGILLSRKKNRFLLNEKELRSAISNEFKLKMIELSLDHDSISFIIEKVSCATLVVGVHGALLVVTMFLPPSSMLIEIFPYAINPNYRTAYRTLSQLPGMDITYGYWVNMDKSMTVTHPFAHPLYGGISHLSIEEQERIKNVTEVPQNIRGLVPELLYHLYQDTVVDISAVINAMKDLEFEKMLNV